MYRLILSLLIVAWASASFAASSFDHSRNVKRVVVALYDGRDAREPTFTQVHKRLELPLNYLGYSVEYHDVRKGLPDQHGMEKAVAVLTWFSRPLEDWRTYLTWAEEQASAGVRFIVVGHPGASAGGMEAKALTNAFLAHLGLKSHFRYVADGFRAEYSKIDPNIIGFERDLFRIPKPFDHYTPIDPNLNVHLSARFVDVDGLKESVLVSSGVGGVFVQIAYTYYYEHSIDRLRWIINPFELLKTALADEPFPIPDTTTLSGQRMYFSHVDGDGWNNVSLIDKYRNRKALSSEVLLHELIEPYPDLPVSIALVTGDFDTLVGGFKKGLKVAKTILAQPQVEPASHTHTHPFKWGFYENYKRADEQKYLDLRAQQVGKWSGKAVLENVGTVVGADNSALRLRRYMSGGTEGMPRAFMRFPFKLDQEIGNSLKFVDSIVPEGKEAKLVQWSGDTQPFEAAIRAARKAGARNMNGGDPRFDLSNPSIAYVPPLSRKVGDERQIYAAASNENTYTNDWTGPFYGFAALGETLKNTESPRRVKPFNIYYHTYSGEHLNSVKAIRTYLDLARSGPYTPVKASHYAAIADSFFDVRLEKRGSLRWAVHDRGELQTYRFDQADNLSVDWARSEGVIGQNRHQGSLYVALDSAVAVPVIALRKTENDADLERPFLEAARWQIKNVHPETCGLSFKAQGFGPGQMTWQGVKPGLYSVSVEGAESRFRLEASVDQGGELSLTLPDVQNRETFVQVNCTGPLRLSKMNGEGTR
ncbi:MAG: hypothetical protein HWE23_03120 [Rhodobacteraceae bacterium]|nr:hypothetical protein [Paracoccaceae bacterium]